MQLSCQLTNQEKMKSIKEEDRKQANIDINNAEFK